MRTGTSYCGGVMTTTLSPFYTKPRLTPDQVASFNRDGYLLPKEPVFPQDEFDALKKHFDEKVAALPPDVRPESMDVPHFSDTDLFRWVLSDAVLDLVEPIIGPDIALFSTHFICKPKGDGRRVPWHEDSAYWKPLVTPAEIVTVWLAIDPSTLKNGCMKVIPRTHAEGRKGFSDYVDVNPVENVFPTEIDPRQRREELAVPCVLDAGQCSLHDARLMHGSDANTSDIRRCGYTMRFMGTHVKLNPDIADFHHIYLARGKDKAGNTYGDPTKTYPEKTRYREVNRKKMH